MHTRYGQVGRSWSDACQGARSVYSRPDVEIADSDTARSRIFARFAETLEGNVNGFQRRKWVHWHLPLKGRLLHESAWSRHPKEEWTRERTEGVNRLTCFQSDNPIAHYVPTSTRLYGNLQGTVRVVRKVRERANETIRWESEVGNVIHKVAISNSKRLKSVTAFGEVIEKSRIGGQRRWAENRTGPHGVCSRDLTVVEECRRRCLALSTT